MTEVDRLRLELAFSQARLAGSYRHAEHLSECFEHAMEIARYWRECAELGSKAELPEGGWLAKTLAAIKPEEAERG